MVARVTHKPDVPNVSGATEITMTKTSTHHPQLRPDGGQPMPPHWFAMSRSGITIKFGLLPCNVTMDSSQWLLYPDSLRVSDLHHAVELLKKVPDNTTLILAYVDTIDTAHYLMESGRMVLDAWTLEDRTKAFAPPIQPPAPPGAGEASQPAEPLPDGHPDSFSMDQLRAELDGKPRVPFGEFYNEPPVINFCNEPLGTLKTGMHLCVHEKGHSGKHSWEGA